MDVCGVWGLRLSEVKGSSKPNTQVRRTSTTATYTIYDHGEVHEQLSSTLGFLKININININK
jgi:hypothetical protein